MTREEVRFALVAAAIAFVVSYVVVKILTGQWL